MMTLPEFLAQFLLNFVAGIGGGFAVSFGMHNRDKLNWNTFWQWIIVFFIVSFAIIYGVFKFLNQI